MGKNHNCNSYIYLVTIYGNEMKWKKKKEEARPQVWNLDELGPGCKETKKK